jgi:hypothetical protein
MTIRTIIVAAAVAGGLIGTASSADAQWRRNGYRTNFNSYTYPSYSTPMYSTSPGVVYSPYSTPMYYTDSGVVVSGYNTIPYTSSSYYVDPYSSGVYGSTYANPYGTGVYGSTYVDPYANWQFNNYVGGYSNLYGNGGVGIGTRGAVFGGRRIRW